MIVPFGKDGTVLAMSHLGIMKLARLKLSFKLV
jgi:hypothetical protein